MSPCLDHRIRTAETLAAISGLVLNVVLGALIFSRGNKNLHAYNRVLALNCLVDMAFSVLNYVVEMHADIRHGLIIVYNNGLYIGDLWTNFLQMCLYFYMIYLSIAIVAVPMVFRYFAICREHALSTNQFILLVVVVMIVPSSVPISAIMLWYSTSQRTLEAYAETIEEIGCHDKGQVVLFHVSEVLTLNVATTIVTAISVVCATYITVVACIVGIWWKSKSFRNQTTTIRRLQQQINYALLAQAIVPLVVIVVPFAALVGTMLSGSEQLHTFTVLSTTFMSFIPLMDPICTIAIIRPYRKALIEGFMSVLRPVAPQLQSIFKGSRVGTSANVPSAITAANLTIAPSQMEPEENEAQFYPVAHDSYATITVIPLLV